jgi:hypothetical protein
MLRRSRKLEALTADLPLVLTEDSWSDYSTLDLISTCKTTPTRVDWDLPASDRERSSAQRRKTGIAAKRSARLPLEYLTSSGQVLARFPSNFRSAGGFDPRSYNGNPPW